MKLSVVISFCSSFATASVARGCQQDTCVKAAIGNYQYPNLDACKSFLLATAVPAPTTVYNVKTVQVHPVVIKRVTKTSTTLVTATKIKSVVKTDVQDVTATDINFETVQVTKVSKVTATRAANPPFKRANNNQPPTIIKPTKVPAAAQNACADAAQFSSACSCMGAKPSTTTLKRQTVVSKRTTSIRLPARTVTRTVTTVTRSKTAQTVLVTETYSTTIVTRVVDTVTVEDEATQTVEATETVVVDPPLQTVRFYTTDSQDPAIGGRAAFLSLQDAGDGYTANFNYPDEAQFGIHPSTGEVKVISGPDTSVGDTLYYSSDDTWSFVFITSPAPDASTGAKPIKCKVDNTVNKLVCRWDDNQLADFWTCRGNTILAPSGSSLGQVCGSTSYRITVYASTA